MLTFNFDTVDSTNDAARRLLAEGQITDSAIVLAREQSAGRGTGGRSWVSPRDAGIYLTLIETNVGLVTPDTALYTLAAGVGCADALTEATGIQVRLKPINDLVAGGGKLGGILTEAFVEAGRLQAIITGIGVNIGRAVRGVDGAALRPSCFEEILPHGQFARLNVQAMVDSLVASVQHWQDLVTRGRGDDVRLAFSRWAVETSGENASEMRVDVSR